MAVERGLTHAVGDALVALVEWVWPRAGRRFEEVLKGVAEAVRPDPPLTIRTLDGLLLTGLIVADRGQVILFLGTRTPSSDGLPLPTQPHTRRYEDGSIPLWARDVDPRDLRDLEVDPYRRR